jgi:uncharacterized protein (UPF0548 family)
MVGRIFITKIQLVQGGYCGDVCTCFGCLNASRILYINNDAHRYGLAYGTLPKHVESGEELFQITIDVQDDVYYTLTAFFMSTILGSHVDLSFVTLFSKEI